YPVPTSYDPSPRGCHALRVLRPRLGGPATEDRARHGEPADADHRGPGVEGDAPERGRLRAAGGGGGAGERAGGADRPGVGDGEPGGPAAPLRGDLDAAPEDLREDPHEPARP